MFIEVGCVNSVCLDEWIFCVCSNKQYSAPLAKDYELDFAPLNTGR